MPWADPELEPGRWAQREGASQWAFPFSCCRVVFRGIFKEKEDGISFAMELLHEKKIN